MRSPGQGAQRAAARSGSREPAGLPFAAAELAAVHDTVARVAGGAELDCAGHRAVADPALEAVGEVARVVAPAKAETNGIAVERAADGTFELGRALMPGQLAAVLFQREAMDAVAVQEIEAQFPSAGDRDGRQPCGLRPGTQGCAQYRDDRIGDFDGLARLPLERCAAR